MSGSHAPRPKKNRDTLHNKEWLERKYWTEGLSTVQIGLILGCSYASVNWALRKFSIPIRTISEGKRFRDKIRPRKTVTQAEVIENYGSKCVCCGETEPRFLTLDHINGGGRKHRKEIGGHRKLKQWLKANNWPRDQYRLLCMNCQFGFMHNGVCPHQE